MYHHLKNACPHCKGDVKTRGNPTEPSYLKCDRCGQVIDPAEIPEAIAASHTAFSSMVVSQSQSLVKMGERMGDNLDNGHRLWFG